MVNINYIKNKSALFFNKREIYSKDLIIYDAFLFINRKEFRRYQNKKERRKLDYLFYYDSYEPNFLLNCKYVTEEMMIRAMSRSIQAEMDRECLNVLLADIDKVLTMDNF